MFALSPFRSIAAGVVLFLSCPTHASDYWCRSYVSQIGQMDGNSVWVQMDAANGGVWAYICSLDPSATTPAQSGCQGWLANLITSKALTRYIDVHFVGTTSATSCATKPNWSVADKPVWIAFP